jgi:hypothetical protein
MRAGLAIVFLVPHVAFSVWTWRTWGNIGGPQLIDHVPFSLPGIARGFVGLLMDRQYGLVADAPIYLAVLAWWMLATRSRPSLGAWLWIVASLVVPMSAYTDWSAGFSPPARYLVPILPFCAVALAESLRFTTMRVVMIALGAAQIVVTLAAWHHPRSLWPWVDGNNPLLRGLGPVGRAYARFLPMVDSGDWRHTAASAAMLGFVSVTIVWLSVRRRPDTASLGAAGVVAAAD